MSRNSTLHRALRAPVSSLSLRWAYKEVVPSTNLEMPCRSTYVFCNDPDWAATDDAAAVVFKECCIVSEPRQVFQRVFSTPALLFQAHSVAGLRSPCRLGFGIGCPLQSAFAVPVGPIPAAAERRTAEGQEQRCCPPGYHGSGMPVRRSSPGGK